jgi:hypothetical protein
MVIPCPTTNMSSRTAFALSGPYLRSTANKRDYTHGIPPGIELPRRCKCPTNPTIRSTTT